jgi:hypothetical protein
MEQEDSLAVVQRSGMGKVKIGSLHTRCHCRWRFSSLISSSLATLARNSFGTISSRDVSEPGWEISFDWLELRDDVFLISPSKVILANFWINLKQVKMKLLSNTSSLSLENAFI